MVLTSSSNKLFPPIREGSAEACGYYRGNVLLLLDYSPLSSTPPNICLHVFNSISVAPLVLSSVSCILTDAL